MRLRDRFFLVQRAVAHAPVRCREQVDLHARLARGLHPQAPTDGDVVVVRAGEKPGFARDIRAAGDTLEGVVAVDLVGGFSRVLEGHVETQRCSSRHYSNRPVVIDGTFPD